MIVRVVKEILGAYQLVSKPMTRMKVRVDEMEKELDIVRKKLDGLDGRLRKVNEKIKGVHSRLENVENNLEMLKCYICKVMKLLLFKESKMTTKIKAPIEPQPLPS